jgi:hypothetical protein
MFLFIIMDVHEHCAVVKGVKVNQMGVNATLLCFFSVYVVSFTYVY